jgi:hypothetical protein
MALMRLLERKCRNDVELIQINRAGFMGGSVQLGLSM